MIYIMIREVIGTDVTYQVSTQTQKNQRTGEVTRMWRDRALGELIVPTEKNSLLRVGTQSGSPDYRLFKPKTHHFEWMKGRTFKHKPKT